MACPGLKHQQLNVRPTHQMRQIETVTLVLNNKINAFKCNFKKLTTKSTISASQQRLSVGGTHFVVTYIADVTYISGMSASQRDSFCLLDCVSVCHVCLSACQNVCECACLHDCLVALGGIQGWFALGGQCQPPKTEMKMFQHTRAVSDEKLWWT